MTHETSAKAKPDFKYYHILVFDGSDAPTIKVAWEYVIADSLPAAEDWAKKSHKSTVDSPKVFCCVEVEAQEVRHALACGAKVACASASVHIELVDEQIARRPTSPLEK